MDWRIVSLRARPSCAVHCAARVGFRAAPAVSPPTAEPFPLQWPHTSDQLHIPPNVIQTRRRTPGGRRHVPTRRRTARGDALGRLPERGRARGPAALRMQLRGSGRKAARRAGHRDRRAFPGRRRRHPALGGGLGAGHPQHVPVGRRRHHHPGRPGRPAGDVPARRERPPPGRRRLPGEGRGRRDRAPPGRAVQAEPAGRLERRPRDRRRRFRRPVARPVRQGHRVLDGPQHEATTASRRSSAARTTWRSRSPSRGRTPTGSRCSPRCTRRTSWAPRTPSTTAPARSSRSLPVPSR